MSLPHALLVATSNTKDLTDKLSQSLHIPYTVIETGEFPNEEIKLKVPQFGDTTILVGSLAKPVNTRIMEYILAADAIKRLGCRHLIGILSWYAYSKQDKVFLPGEPLSAKVIANVLQTTTIRDLYTLDLHNPSIAGYFEIPVLNLSAVSLFITYLSKQDLSETYVVSPDAGSIKNSTKIADALGIPIAYAAKSRNLETGEVTITEINRDIDSKNVLIFDDMIASGSTLLEISSFLKSRGAKLITVCCTHHLYLEGVQAKLDQSAIDHLIVTNSIEKPAKVVSEKLTVIDASPIFADALAAHLEL